MSEVRPRQTGEAGFEREDLGARSVFTFLIGLALVVTLVCFVVWGMYSYLDAYQRAHQPVQNPLTQRVAADTRVVTPSDITTFPEPRLEENERLEINDFRQREERALNSYGWVNEKAGVVHIPIERAMQLLEERGLPVLPQNGANSATPERQGRKADKAPAASQHERK